MSLVRIIDKETVLKTLKMDEVIQVVENCYVQKASGMGKIWPMVFQEFPGFYGDMDIKSGQLDEDGFYGLKLVSWFRDNPQKNLPQLFGTSLLFDIKTGEPKALINATAMTGMRTGAAGAIGAKYLARKDSRSLLIVGTGHLAPYLIVASLISIPTLEEVKVINPHNSNSNSEKLLETIEEVDKLLDDISFKRNTQINLAKDLESAVKTSDIIMTATPSYSPLIKADWVNPGTHISTMGADISGKQELDSEILRKAKIVVDDIEQSISVGECEIPIKEKVIEKSHVNLEIGEIIIDSSKSRANLDEITIFDSTGIALQDIACGILVFKKAEEMKLGKLVEL